MNWMISQNTSVSTAYHTANAWDNILRMPFFRLFGPIRICQFLSGRSDKVCLVFLQNLFRFFRRLDSACNHNRNIYNRFYLSGHVRTISPWIKSRGMVCCCMGSSHQIQQVYAFLFQYFTYLDTLFQTDSIGLAIIHAQFYTDGEIRSHCFANTPYNLN